MKEYTLAGGRIVFLFTKPLLFLGLIMVLQSSAQRYYCLTAGFSSNQLSKKIFNWHQKITPGGNLFQTGTPTFGVGLVTAVHSIGMMKYKSKVMIGFEFTNILLQPDSFLPPGLWHTNPIENARYKETYFYVRYIPQIIILSDFYIAPVINYSNRISYNPGNQQNIYTLQKYGILDSNSGNNNMKKGQVRIGAEAGFRMFKKRLEVGAQITYSLFPTFEYYDVDRTKYFYACGSLFVNYRIKNRN